MVTGHREPTVSHPIDERHAGHQCQCEWGEVPLRLAAGPPVPYSAILLAGVTVSGMSNLVPHFTICTARCPLCAMTPSSRSRTLRSYISEAPHCCPDRLMLHLGGPRRPGGSGPRRLLRGPTETSEPATAKPPTHFAIRRHFALGVMGISSNGTQKATCRSRAIPARPAPVPTRYLPAAAWSATRPSRSASASW